MIEFFLPLILLPAATFLFWLRKKSGWILLAVYLTYSVIGTLGLIIMNWNMEPLGIPFLDSLFPQAPLAIQILTILFFVGVLWILTKKEIREHFKIKRQAAITIITITAVLTILLVAPFMMM